MSRKEVLNSLLRRQGSWTSGEDMASSLGISRAAIWKHIRSLRAEGYQIESSRRGYRLVDAPDLLHRELVENGLRTKFVGQEVHFYPEAISTNAIAKDIALSARNGTVVLAEVQTGGKGRMDRTWHSPSGGVWMSVILKPPLPPSLAFRANVAACLAVARAVSGLYGLEVGIKWPNDIIVGGKKICGILTEMSAEMDWVEYVVVGMGINANLRDDQFQPQWKATSLSIEMGREVSRVELVQRTLWEMEKAYGEMISSFDRLHAEWSERSTTLGRRVRIVSREGEFKGQAVALDEDGALRVREDEGSEKRVLAGDCIHLRPEVNVEYL